MIRWSLLIILLILLLFVISRCIGVLCLWLRIGRVSMDGWVIRASRVIRRSGRRLLVMVVMLKCLRLSVRLAWCRYCCACCVLSLVLFMRLIMVSCRVRCVMILSVFILVIRRSRLRVVLVSLCSLVVRSVCILTVSRVTLGLRLGGVNEDFDFWRWYCWYSGCCSVGW